MFPGLSSFSHLFPMNMAITGGPMGPSPSPPKNHRPTDQETLVLASDFPAGRRTWAAANGLIAFDFGNRYYTLKIENHMTMTSYHDRKWWIPKMDQSMAIFW